MIVSGAMSIISTAYKTTIYEKRTGLVAMLFAKRLYLAIAD